MTTKNNFNLFNLFTNKKRLKIVYFTSVNSGKKFNLLIYLSKSIKNRLKRNFNLFIWIWEKIKKIKNGLTLRLQNILLIFFLALKRLKRLKIEATKNM